MVGRWLSTRNRAEELGEDVWEHFVIPPSFDRLALADSRKPRVIVGGRGCGKTMLLRYLAHSSIFSLKRESIPDDAVGHIGLYWRADTQFAASMSGRGLEQDTWDAAFQHLCALMLGIQVLESVKTIAASSCSVLRDQDLETIDLSRINAFDKHLSGNVIALRDQLEDRLWTFETWVNDVREVEQPRFLPGQRFVLALIQLVERCAPTLADATYYVYVDEFENLNVHQKRLVNTWVKHSETPLVFNLAMKRNAFEPRQTVGPESLSKIHDVRDFDLETYDFQTEFPVFAAEILFLQMSMAGFKGIPIDPDLLRDPERLSERKDSHYCRKILDAASHLLPGKTEQEMAAEVLGTDSLRHKLTARITERLKIRGSDCAPESFVRNEYPEASVVVPALLARKNTLPEDVLEELNKLSRGEPNRFSGATDWIHNNFVGCLLQLYDSVTRPCPFYGGFRTFCLLAKGNLRHFLELSQLSLRTSVSSESVQLVPVPVDRQAAAAREASTDFLREVRTFGPLGNRLHTFVLRLGSLFALSQSRSTQSEPERTHFSIHRGRQELTSEDDEFLAEAIKWSVLSEEKETKKKSDKIKSGSEEPEVTEYVLNPIYSPYFAISYRKRRKLDLSTDEAICLTRGSYSDVSTLLREFAHKWEVNVGSEGKTLFSHLDDEELS